jgi:predicted Zn-dependent protease
MDAGRARRGSYGAGAVAADVFSQRSIEVEVREGKVEKLQEAGRHGLSIAVYLDHRYSSHSTNDHRTRLAGAVHRGHRGTKRTAIEKGVLKTWYIGGCRAA